MALVLALAGLGHEVVVGHVVHDFRPQPETAGDREHVRALATRLGLAFDAREVAVRSGGGNGEARGRAARYAALAEMAREHGCGWIATAHHAEDQLETMLLRLMRGAGAAGLAGIRERTRLGGVPVIRPMLALTRADAHAICLAAGESWRTDDTNQDTQHDRAYLRHEVVPRLLERWPRGALRAAQAGRLLAGAARRLEREWRALSKRAGRGASVWDRAILGAADDDVLGAWLRGEALTRGVRSSALSAQRVDQARRAMRARADRRRTMLFGGLRLTIDATHVRLEGEP